MVKRRKEQENYKIWSVILLGEEMAGRFYASQQVRMVRKWRELHSFTAGDLRHLK
jgi:hypothetical protein